MKIHLLVFLFSCYALENAECMQGKKAKKVGPCSLSTIKGGNRGSEYTCFQITTLTDHLDRARGVISVITVYDSDLPYIAGHTFARFGATLLKLDLHGSGIVSIDPHAFLALTKLERLILWGNKLTQVPVEWFENLSSLKLLDLSFNLIATIDAFVYPKLGNLEYLNLEYNQLNRIDYNLFGYMPKLKTVTIGKNPWDWVYRISLMWQLDNQKVSYKDRWEDWSWLSNVVRTCTETGESAYLNDQTLDCAVKKLLNFVSENFKSLNTDKLFHDHAYLLATTPCAIEASRLHQCSRAKSGNSTESTRKILQGIAANLSAMDRTTGIYHMK